MILTGFMMVILTICMYVIARYIQNKFNYSILNPALIASLAIIFILIICGLDYKDYMIGGQWISKFLDCTVVCLAYPLYKYRHMIMRNLKVIMTSVVFGILLNFIIIYFVMNLFGFSKQMIVTLLPRSITTAVGIQVSHQMGGLETLSIIFIIATGLIGSILGSSLIKIGNFQSSIAKGLTYGNASHAFGTAKALELDLESGAFSSSGMILTAVLSSIFLPFIITLFY